MEEEGDDGGGRSGDGVFEDKKPPLLQGLNDNQVGPSRIHEAYYAIMSINISSTTNGSKI